MRCSALQCVAVRCSALQCVAVRCSVLQYVAVCCSALQRAAACGSALQWLLILSYFPASVINLPTIIYTHTHIHTHTHYARYEQDHFRMPLSFHSCVCFVCTYKFVFVHFFVFMCTYHKKLHISYTCITKNYVYIHEYHHI